MKLLSHQVNCMFTSSKTMVLIFFYNFAFRAAFESVLFLLYILFSKALHAACSSWDFLFVLVCHVVVFLFLILLETTCEKLALIRFWGIMSVFVFSCRVICQTLPIRVSHNGTFDASCLWVKRGRYTGGNRTCCLLIGTNTSFDRFPILLKMFKCFLISVKAKHQFST